MWEGNGAVTTSLGLCRICLLFLVASWVSFFPTPLPPFPTEGDMAELFLSKKKENNCLATWFSQEEEETAVLTAYKIPASLC